MKATSIITENAILQMAGKTSGVRAREIREAGLRPEYLRKLCKNGHLIRNDRGLYSLAENKNYDASVRQHRLAKSIVGLKYFNIRWRVLDQNERYFIQLMGRGNR